VTFVEADTEQRPILAMGMTPTSTTSALRVNAVAKAFVDLAARHRTLARFDRSRAQHCGRGIRRVVDDMVATLNRRGAPRTP
jgi:hypothetical protein